MLCTGVIFWVAFPAAWFPFQNRRHGCLPLDPKPQAACLPHGTGHHPTSSSHFLLPLGLWVSSDGLFLRVFAGCFIHWVVSQKFLVGGLFRVSDPQRDLLVRTVSLIWLGRSSSGRPGRSWGESSQCPHTESKLWRVMEGGAARSRDPGRELLHPCQGQSTMGWRQPRLCHPNAAVQTLQRVAVCSWDRTCHPRGE